jgi:hypothetical protein
MWWEFVLAVLTAAGSVAGSIWAIKAVVKHDERACDARLEAFKEGLEHRE